MLGRKKGQTAMEYLMTYGWAILAVLVIGGVLYYYGVFSPQTLVGESKTGFSQVDVSQWAVSGDTIDLVLANRAGEEINITEVYVNGNSLNLTALETLSAGETDVAIRSGDYTGTLGDDYGSGDAYQLDVSIQFNYTSTHLAKNSSGKLSGTV